MEIEAVQYTELENISEFPILTQTLCLEPEDIEYINTLYIDIFSEIDNKKILNYKDCNNNILFNYIYELRKNRVEDIEKDNPLEEEISKIEKVLYHYNKPLVNFFLKQYISFNPDLSIHREDLFQAGSLGLVTAIKRYDLKKGFTLATYAGYYIKKEIRDAISDTNYFKINKGDQRTISKILRDQREENISLEEAIKIHIKDKDSQTYFHSLITSFKPQSLDYLEEETGERIGVEDTHSSGLMSKLSRLTKREIQILHMSYLEYPMEEIGLRVGGISKERVRKIRNKSLKKLLSENGTRDILRI